jgi:hypothetical protein
MFTVVDEDAGDSFRFKTRREAENFVKMLAEEIGNTAHIEE